jgi:hypothetical protein
MLWKRLDEAETQLALILQSSSSFSLEVIFDVQPRRESLPGMVGVSRENNFSCTGMVIIPLSRPEEMIGNAHSQCSIVHSCHNVF